MTTPTTTAWERWLATPNVSDLRVLEGNFNAFVASEVAAVERGRDEDRAAVYRAMDRAETAESRAALAEKRVGEAEGLLRECDNALKVVHDALYAFKTGPGATRASDGTLGNIVRGQRASIAALLSPPAQAKNASDSPAQAAPAGYGPKSYSPKVGDVVRETVSPFPEHRGEWLVWADISESLYLCRPGKSRHPSFQRSKGCAPMEFVRPATPAEATAAGLERAGSDGGQEQAASKLVGQPAPSSPSRAAEADPVGAGIAYAHGLMRTTEVPLGREDMARWYDLRDAYAEGVKAGRPPPPSAGITAEERAFLHALAGDVGPLSKSYSAARALLARDGKEVT